MKSPIERIAVIGAGTMGASIAAHAANAGLPVLLLDIVPSEPSPAESARGLGLDRPEVRDRIVREGFERMKKLKPRAFMSAAAERLVSLGNLEDDLGRLAEADWIIEVVVERLEVKRALLARIDEVRRPGSLVTSNTSGLPIDSIVAGRSADLARCFFGTHFFNPPRYMKLLEIIPGSASDPQAVAAFATFAAERLGKGVVLARDTPNFIANRLLSIHLSYLMDRALADGYRFEEIDALTGPLIGRPKTATIRLQDLVGIDISHGVGRNLYELIPHDPQREVLRAPAFSRVVDGLMARGRLGDKTGSGFYRKSKGAGGATEILVLDPETFDYEPQRKVRFEAVGAVRTIEALGERLRALFAERWRDDRGARLAWTAVAHLLAYAADRAAEIAHDLAAVDRAVRWGFAYELGPFELWDELGVAETAVRLRASGFTVAPWVEEMLAAGCSTFYRRAAGRATGCYDWESRGYRDLPADPRHLAVEQLRAAGRELERNAGASLLDLGEGVLLLELHTKMNVIDGDVIAMMDRARALLAEPAWQGLVIGNDGAAFCAGADLAVVGTAAQAGDLAEIAAAVAALQRALQAFRAAPRPVVAAVHGLALGGGAEIALSGQRVVAAAESYVGLVEVGVGLVPAGGGLKEMVRRHLSPVMANEDGDPLPVAQRILQTVGLAKVSSSAAEARELGFLGPRDRIVMNRDHLLYEARREVLAMVAEGFAPEPPAPLWAGGGDLAAALRLGVWSLAQAGFASEHDATVVGRIAWILAGGALSAPTWVEEGYFLDLEREAFLELARHPLTQERIRHLLETGKALRN